MSTRSFARQPPPGARRTDQSEVETVRPPDREAGADLLALFVSGPNGDASHLLPSRGLVNLGRSDQSDIVLDDRTASRSHAVLHIADRVMLSDAGSANGTFVGEERLLPGSARVLLPGQSFQVGDLTLLVRASGLKAIRPSDVTTLEQLPARLAAVPPVGDHVTVRARVERARDRSFLEVIMANVAATFSADGMAVLVVRLGECQTGLVVRTGDVSAANTNHGESTTAALERQMVEQYGRWGLCAELETIRVRASSPGAICREVCGFLEGERGGDAAPAVLGRRTVIIHDRAMDEVRNTVDKVAGVVVPVLILGETGVGKDVVASMLHDLSPRHQRPFLRINCASLPESLLESELFGHERGAFTGATHAKAGLLEAANGGTVFLDEIGELALGMQAKLLTAIESREVTRIGALQPRLIDVRFVAATNRRLAMEVEAGRFRSDLFYRLHLVTVTVPPLRDRPADIAPLARHFLDQARIRFDLPTMSLSAATIAALQAWRWPGNVRELRNEMERAALMSAAALIEPHHLSFLAVARPVAKPAPVERGDPDFERRSIQEALRECAGNQSRAAQVLRMSRRTLVRKIARLGLRRPLARPLAEPTTIPFDETRDVPLKS